MALSKSTYECYTCRRNGFPEIRVYLDGKTEDGKKTIYKNEDMSPHQHKVKQQTVTSTATAPTTIPSNSNSSTPVTTDTLESTIKLYFDSINAKIDKIIGYLDSQEK